MSKTAAGAKLSQFFKKRKRITTRRQIPFTFSQCKVISIFQKAQANHNHCAFEKKRSLVQSYLNFSKSASESQLASISPAIDHRAKLSQFFKKRKRITTAQLSFPMVLWCKVISIFQKAQANHNTCDGTLISDFVQSYLNFSKSASESQHHGCFTGCNPVQSYLNFSKSASESQPTIMTALSV